MILRLLLFTARIVAVTAGILALGVLLGLAIHATTAASPTQSHGDASAPSLETRTAEAYARLALHAFSGTGQEEGLSPTRTGGGTPPAVGSGQIMLPDLEAGDAKMAGGAGSSFPPVPSADYSACPTPCFVDLRFVARSGLMSTYGAGWSPNLIALPDGPAWRFRVCGAAGCLTLISTDAGPSKAMQRAPYNRIVDLPVWAFERVSGVSWRMGLAPVSLTILGRAR